MKSDTLKTLFSLWLSFHLAFLFIKTNGLLLHTHTSGSIITVFPSRAGPSGGGSAGPALYIVCTSETGWDNAYVQFKHNVHKIKTLRVTESCKVSPADTVFILQSVS